MAENRWCILAVLFLARLAVALQFQTVGSLGALLVDALDIDYAQLGTLIGLYMLPGAVIALVSGVLGQRFGARRVVLVVLVLMAAGGAATAASASFLPMAVGRLLSGVGAVLLNVLLAKMVTDWFAGREIVSAMSIFITSWPIGIALGLVAYAPLAGAAGWSAVMLAAAGFAVFAWVLVAIVYRDPPGAAPPGRARLGLDLDGREWSLVSLAGAAWGLYNVAYVALVSFAPDYLSATGYSPVEASWLVSLLGWALIPTVPAGGYLAERSRRPGVVLAGGCIAVALALALVPVVDLPILLSAVVLAAIGLPAGGLVALPAQVLRAQVRAAGMGVFYAWYYASMAVLPVLAGMARDSAGAAAPLLFAAAMMLVATACFGAFRALQVRA